MMFINNEDGILLNDNEDIAVNSDSDRADSAAERSDDDILIDTQPSFHCDGPLISQQHPTAPLSHGNILLDEYTGHVTEKLAAAGAAGISAATAIASIKRKAGDEANKFKFEINPSVRKRIQTRLLRKMKSLVEEYSVRVGQQMAMLVASPGKPSMFKCYGTSPLDVVLSINQANILTDLEEALEHVTTTCNPNQYDRDDSDKWQLPPLVFDGIPTGLDKMTQSQLRAFIPIMLKYSTGRGKPGWGKVSLKPPWWPGHLPWLNIRSDNRPEEQKARVSWTEALRQIVSNCYQYHDRQDLLHIFMDTERDRQAEPVTAPASVAQQQQVQHESVTAATVGGAMCEPEAVSVGAAPTTVQYMLTGIPIATAPAHHLSTTAAVQVEYNETSPNIGAAAVMSQNDASNAIDLTAPSCDDEQQQLQPVVTVAAAPALGHYHLVTLPISATAAMSENGTTTTAGAAAAATAAAMQPAVVHIPLSVYNTLSGACQQLQPPLAAATHGTAGVTMSNHIHP